MLSKSSFFNSLNIGEIIRFGITGCVATLIQFIVYYLLVRFTSHNIALPVSYTVSLFFNFIMTSLFTFKVKPDKKKGIGFLTSHLVNFSLQFAFLNFFIFIGIEKQWAIIPTFLLCFPVTFLLVRLSMKKL